jgi:hypothetical protein
MELKFFFHVQNQCKYINQFHEVFYNVLLILDEKITGIILHNLVSTKKVNKYKIHLGETIIIDKHDKKKFIVVKTF